MVRAVTWLGLGVLLLAATPATQTSTETADVFVDGAKAFVLQRTIQRTGPHARVKSTFFDRGGRVALVFDAAVYGDRPSRVRVEQRQSKERGVVRVGSGKVGFEVRTAEGETETSDEEALGIVFVGPALTDWMVSEGPWRRLMAGEQVEFKVAAWRRMAVYSFRLEKVASPDPTKVVLQMEPTNLVYRAFAGDMRYVIDKATRRHLEYHGITALKQPDDDGDLEDVTARIVYR